MIAKDNSTEQVNVCFQNVDKRLKGMRSNETMGDFMKRLRKDVQLGLVGEIKIFPVAEVEGCLLLDGSIYFIEDYPDLFAFLYKYFPECKINDKQFRVPDYRECHFVMCGRNADPSKNITRHDVFKANEFKDDAFQQHTHSSGQGSGRWNLLSGSTLGYGRTGDANGSTANVTRPKSIGVFYHIVY